MKKLTTVVLSRAISFLLIGLAAGAACAPMAGAAPVVRTELEAEPDDEMLDARLRAPSFHAHRDVLREPGRREQHLAGLA